jgi:hypothetical protein
MIAGRSYKLNVWTDSLLTLSLEFDDTVRKITRSKNQWKEVYNILMNSVVEVPAKDTLLLECDDGNGCTVILKEELEEGDPERYKYCRYRG